MKPFRNILILLLSLLAPLTNGQFSADYYSGCDSLFIPDANFEIKNTTTRIAQLPYVFISPKQPDSTLTYSYQWFLSKASDTLEYLNDTTVTDEGTLIHSFDSVGIYIVRLIVRSSAGCSATVTRIVEVSEILDIPNFFSPDGNGRNDLWIIRSTMNYNYTEYNVRIFTRTGNLIYQAEKTEIITWDGRNQSGQEMSEGTYYYLIENPQTGFNKAGFVYIFRDED